MELKPGTDSRPRLIEFYLKTQAPDYYELLNKEGFLRTSAVRNLEGYLAHEFTNPSTRVLPKKENVFKALELCKLNNLKVVVLGESPSPHPEESMGLAYSVPSGIRMTATLQNIMKALYFDLGTLRSNGNLTDWATQGVLLLNTALTVQEGIPASHQDKGWTPLIDELIWRIDEVRPKMIWCLWGDIAKSKKPLIRSKQAFIIESSHPNMLTAHQGFLEHRPFSRINGYLEHLRLSKIKF